MDLFEGPEAAAPPPYSDAVPLFPGFPEHGDFQDLEEKEVFLVGIIIFLNLGTNI